MVRSKDEEADSSWDLESCVFLYPLPGEDILKLLIQIATSSALHFKLIVWLCREQVVSRSELLHDLQNSSPWGSVERKPCPFLSYSMMYRTAVVP